MAGAAAAAAAFGLPPPPHPAAAAAAAPEEEELLPGHQQQHQLPAARGAAASSGTAMAGPASVVEEAVADGLRRLQDPLDGAALSAGVLLSEMPCARCPLPDVRCLL